MHKPQILEYKTDRLPLHFIILGYLLAATGIWRIIAGDWMGILYLFIGTSPNAGSMPPDAGSLSLPGSNYACIRSYYLVLSSSGYDE